MGKTDKVNLGPLTDTFGTGALTTMFFAVFLFFLGGTYLVWKNAESRDSTIAEYSGKVWLDGMGMPRDGEHNGALYMIGIVMLFFTVLFALVFLVFAGGKLVRKFTGGK